MNLNSFIIPYNFLMYIPLFTPFFSPFVNFDHILTILAYFIVIYYNITNSVTMKSFREVKNYEQT